MQPDEETGSAEEQPASNMAASKLETVEYRSRSVRGGFNFTRMAIPLRKPLSSVREKLFVNGYVWQRPVERFVIHGHAAHQCQHRFFVGHCGSHSGYTAEVAVEAFYPVGGVYHSLNFRSIVEICQICFVIWVVTQTLD